MCLKWLARREYGRTELTAKLSAKGYAGVLIRDVLDSLEDKGMQSDGRFLESFIRSCYQKGQGPLKIRFEMKLRGGDVDELEAALAGYDWDEALSRVHQKKFGEAPPSTPKEQLARIRFLTQRGFEQEKIQALFRRFRRFD